MQPCSNKNVGKNFSGEQSNGGLNIVPCNYVLIKRDGRSGAWMPGAHWGVESLHTNEGLSTAPQSSEGGHTTILKGGISIILVFLSS